MRACVTGSAGLVGSHLCDLLLAEGWDVVGYDAFLPESPQHVADDLWALYRRDVREADSLVEAAKGCDVIFHQAAIGGFLPDPTEMVEVNVMGTANVMRAAREAGCRKVVLASSQAVYGYGRCGGGWDLLPRTMESVRESWAHPCAKAACRYHSGTMSMSENHEPKPASVYGETKLAAERLALRMGAEWGLPVTALRYALTYGPRQSASNPYVGICAQFAAKLRAEQPVPIFEDGQQTRDFTYVGDVARANLWAALDRKTDGEILNVGTGVATTVEDFLSDLAFALRVEDWTVTRGDWRPQDARHVVTDVSKFNALGWRADTSVEQGLTAYAGWLLGRPELVDAAEEV